jgi:hypothetical protein
MFKKIVQEVFDYLIGFIALAFFAAYAFAQGVPTDDRWVSAFKWGALIGMCELAFLMARKRPANRLIVGGNLWLCGGGISAFFEQWWYLKAYEKYGEASLFFFMLVVGFCTVGTSPAGFVGHAGEATRVRRASVVLLVAVLIVFAFAVLFQTNAKLAAVIPVVGLAWLNRALRIYVDRT